MMKIIYLISIVGALCACNTASKKKQNEKEKTMKCVTFDGNSVSTLFIWPHGRNTIRCIPNVGNKLLII